jgi:hypothetical protein
VGRRCMLQDKYFCKSIGQVAKTSSAAELPIATEPHHWSVTWRGWSGPEAWARTLGERVVHLHEIGLNCNVGKVGKANFDMHCTCRLGHCMCGPVWIMDMAWKYNSTRNEHASKLR